MNAARMLMWLVIGLCLSGTVVRADDKAPPPKTSSSLDDELLKDLGGDPAKDNAPTAKPKPSAPPAKPKTSDSLDDELLKGLGGNEPEAAKGAAAGEGDENPLVGLNRRMREVEQRMRAAKGDDETQTMQKEILRDLEKLIEELEQQQQQQSSSSSSKDQKQQQTADRKPQQQPQMKPGSGKPMGKPTDKPVRDSSDKTTSRQTQKPDMAQMQEILKDIWGELPPRLRQQMMQSSVEKFVPKYELLIEEYFKVLAEKQRDAGGQR